MDYIPQRFSYMVCSCEPKPERLRVLLVDAARRRVRHSSPKGNSDDGLWYPPIGLLKLATLHRRRGDEVRWAVGIDAEAAALSPWDRVYVGTVFTFDFDHVVKVIAFYKKATSEEHLLVGGPAATIIASDIERATGVKPTLGLLRTARQLGLDDDTDVDRLPLDYGVLDGKLYAINDTYYAFSTRGCINRCSFCGVTKHEPIFEPRVAFADTLREMRASFGDKRLLKLMDNNVLASPELGNIVEDLLALGYQRGGPRQVDFNQGLEASLFDEERASLLAKLNVNPLRIAFDRFSERDEYVRAVRLAMGLGFTAISNYLLFNYQDTPRDLYERIVVNIDLNAAYAAEHGKRSGPIYSYPMRYAAVRDEGTGDHLRRNPVRSVEISDVDWRRDPAWTPRFLRSIEVMRGSSGGFIPMVPGLARRAVGRTYDEYVANLYMSDRMLRERNKHERTIYPGEPEREPGSGKVEEFRDFIGGLLRDQGGERFIFFHRAVSENRVDPIRQALAATDDDEMRYWLSWYLSGTSI